jgi:hypothetical protein
MDQKSNVELLVEKWLETGEDCVLDKVDAEFKKVNHGFIGKRVTEKSPVLEHNDVRPTRLQAFMVLNERWNERDVNLRITIEGLSQNQIPLAALRVIDRERGVTSVGCREIGGAVLISVRQRVQDCNGVHFIGLTHRARVEFVDELPSFFRDTLKDLTPCRSVIIGVGRHGVLSSTTGRGGFAGADERTDDIVQCGSGVMDAFSDQDAETRRRVLLHGHLDTHLASIEIDVHQEFCTATLAVGARFVVKEFKMFTGSNEFIGDDIDVRSHGREHQMAKRQTTPKGAEIPIPKRGDFLANLKKAATPTKSKRRATKKR